MQRPIIEIDETKCDGCGQCVLDCAEGALAIIDGKAKLISESFCDGLGACLHCPQGALSIITREAVAFDEEAANAAKQSSKHSVAVLKTSCPGSALLSRRTSTSTWPIQLRLLPPTAPFLKGAKILLAAHCTGFLSQDFHDKIRSGYRLVIACPKLEPQSELLEKLIAILKEGKPVSIDILRMGVPCCGGLERLVQDAIIQCSLKIPVQTHTVAVP